MHLKSKTLQHGESKLDDEETTPKASKEDRGSIGIDEPITSKVSDLPIRELSRKVNEASSQLSEFEPLVASHINLAKFPWAPVRLGFLESHPLLLIENAEPFRALIVLIAKAWKEQPAGTLPNNNNRLAEMAGFGRDVNAWNKVRDEVLDEWILAIDGRWHHAETAGWVHQAWESKLRAEAFSEQQRQRAQIGAAKRRSASLRTASVISEKLSTSSDETTESSHGFAAAQPKRKKENKKNIDNNNKNKKNNNNEERMEKDDFEAPPLPSNILMDQKFAIDEKQEDTQKGNGVDQIKFIFEHWKYTTNRPSEILNQDRSRIIHDRIKEGLSVEILCRAIDGAAGDDFYQGRTSKQPSRIDTLDIIFKNHDRITRLASMDHSRRPLKPHHGFSDAGQATAHAFMQAFERPAGKAGLTPQSNISEIEQ